MFVPLENNRPFAKIALEGFAGDGKTFTACNIAIGIWKLIQSKKPVAVFDTEKALKANKKMFDKHGIKVFTAENQRSLKALNEAIKWCEAGNADILIIDSITHVWENFCEAYKKSKNRSSLQFQDWGILKPQWKSEFSELFVNSPVHIIFTGRAGYEYDNQVNAETNKKELVKTGIKMKAETETAFEPDLLVLMEKEVESLGKKKKVTRFATVLKDRTDMIDGKCFENPTFDDFYPAIKELLDGELNILHGGEVIPDTFEVFEDRFYKNKIRYEVALEEIKGCFALIGLSSTGKAEQQTKSWLLKQTFNVTSLEGVGNLPLNQVEAGQTIIKNFSSEYAKYLEECSISQTTPDREIFMSLYQKAKAGKNEK